MKFRLLPLLVLLYGLAAHATEPGVVEDAWTAEAPPIADAPAEEAEEEEEALPQISQRIFLDDLGHAHGWTFEGLDSGHLQTFRFPLPRLSEVRSATFRIGHTTVPGLSSHSMLRIEADGQPLHSSGFDDGGTQWLNIPVPADLLATDGRDFIDLTVRASLLMSDDRCEDERISAGFLHVAPTSGLALVLGEPEHSVAGAWEALPRDVVLSLPSQPDEAAFIAALTLIRHLEQAGKNIEIVRLPQVGDIIVAPALEADTAIADLPGGVDALSHAAADGNVRAIALLDHRLIAFDPRNAKRPASLAEADWMRLARAPALDVHSLAGRLHRPLPAAAEDASFALLGANMAAQDVVRSAEWWVPLGLDRIPAGRLPAHTRITVTSAPVHNENPMMLYAYIDGILQDVHRLKGGTESFTLHFASATLRAGSDLRLIVSRDPVIGDCRAPIVGLPVQISPASTVVFERAPDTPSDLGDLPALFTTGAELVIAPQLVAHAETSLPFIARLLNANSYRVSEAGIRIADAPADPESPFIFFSAQAGDVNGQTVHFDRGRIMVSNDSGDTLLDMGSPDHLTVAQLVERNGQHGLWVKPPASSLLPIVSRDTLALTFDKAAFIDDRGVALSLSSEHTDFARLDYPAHRDWFDVLGAYRYWLMALGWLLVAGLLAHLYVKVRSHKKPR